MRWFILSLFFGAQAFGLSNAYVTFDHPEGWDCELLKGLWVCQSPQEPHRRESIIFSIAAQASQWDNLSNYERYLKKVKRIQDEDGSVIRSSVKFVRKRKIAGHQWVDSLQLNSELPGFYARYVATLHKTPKMTLAVLITYIVSEKYYSKMAPKFEKLISSLRLKKDFNLNVASKQKGTNLLGGQILGEDPGELTKNILKERLRRKPEAEVAPDMTNVILGLLVLMVIGYIFLSRMKKVRKAKKGKTEPGNKKAS